MKPRGDHLDLEDKIEGRNTPRIAIGLNSCIFSDKVKIISF